MHERNCADAWSFGPKPLVLCNGARARDGETLSPQPSRIKDFSREKSIARIGRTT